VICRGPEGDEELLRVQVWEDELWRLTTSVSGDPVPGFSYLEPKRHIPFITDLDGDEALTFGPVMARVTGALKEATGAEVVYVYVFGEGIPHLHIHLGPHRSGDGLNDRMVKGELVEQRLPSGATLLVSREHPPLTEEELRGAADRICVLLSRSRGTQRRP
jgi:diadenosine tetraphosphate (Ap4A) HIT family hydrolase